VDVFFALQVGQWMAEGSGITNSFDFKFDSFVLLGPNREPSAVPKNSVPEISVYPNPVSSEIHIKSPVQVQTVRLFNLLGQEIKSLDNIGKNHVQMNVSGLAEGIYILSVEDYQGNIRTKKITKK